MYNEIPEEVPHWPRVSIRESSLEEGMSELYHKDV